jgi:hypothetical protein
MQPLISNDDLVKGNHFLTLKFESALDFVCYMTFKQWRFLEWHGKEGIAWTKHGLPVHVRVLDKGYTATTQI